MPQKPIEICRHCIDGDFHQTNFNNEDWEQFNTNHCVTECKNGLVPNHLPKEQVIKYLNLKFK